MRAFIAIELPCAIRDYLSQIQNKLKTSGSDVKWVDPKNIHLTIKFLGGIEDKTIDQITGILEAVSCYRPFFYIRISRLGAFPNINAPRIIWAGIDKGNNESEEIAKELEKKIVKIGIPKEDKPFSAHLTIGRSRSAFNRGNLAKMIITLQEEIMQEKIEFCVNKLTLFKSTLTPAGPIYTVLKEANLKIK
ncbi:RNA 2',3'-cyclic phosphodiesterase [bacterium]|nr:MAG: RNA 2',3'-cyclic phosphodiesterase [bacterium]